MAAKARTLKRINEAIESCKKSMEWYFKKGNSGMVSNYKKHLDDSKYIKSLIEKDMKK
jgi:hypothetical protein